MYLAFTQRMTSGRVYVYCIYRTRVYVPCVYRTRVYVPCIYTENVPLVGFIYLVFTQRMYL